MSLTPYFKSFKLERYRGFLNCELKELRRINVIGGANGAGKTSLLEALFLYLDRGNPTFILRTPMFRNQIVDFQKECIRLFFRGNNSTTITLSAKSNEGTGELNISYGNAVNAPQSITFQVSNFKENYLPSPTTSSLLGLKVALSLNHKNVGECFYSEAPGGVTLQVTKPFPAGVRGAMISPFTRYIAQDLAERFTEVINQSHFDRLMKALKIIQPDLERMQILQVSGQPIVHGDIGIGIQMPIGMLGDGVLTVTCIIASILCAKDGVIFIDEFDATVHYSKLREIWAVIGELAEEFNCQLFISTHSRECIQAANDGLSDQGLSKDLSYIRLDRTNHDIKPTTYKPEELNGALEEEWEIR